MAMIEIAKRKNVSERTIYYRYKAYYDKMREHKGECDRVIEEIISKKHVLASAICFIRGNLNGKENN